MKAFRKRFRDLRELLIDEITDFGKVMNEDFTLIVLIFLSNRSRRLKALKNEKNKDEKTLKLYRFELSDAKRFVNEKTLIMK